MFAENAWDPWAGSLRRGWTTLVSFTLQALGIGFLLLVPLIYTGRPPQLDFARRIFVPLPPAGSQSSAARPAPIASSSNYSREGILLVPPSIPRSIPVIDDRGIPPAIDAGIGVAYGTGSRFAANSVINSIGEMSQPFVPKPPVPATHAPRVSAIMTGYLVHKVDPVYPPLARAARVQGIVELQAVISKQGTIEKLQVLRGHPLLVQAAVEAVQQWRYRPYVLNSEPVEVETHVTVNFLLSGQ